MRQATDFGPVAMQPSTIEALAGRRLPMSEDCLTLNIWSPGADGQRRPVLTLLQRCQHLVGERWPAVAPLYLHAQRAGEPLLPRLLALLTFDQFTFPAIQLAEAQACLGAPVWVYRFDWPSPVFGGAAHSLDRLFVWNDLETPGARRMTGEAPERQHLAHQMQDAWLAFARHGDPATPDLPWPRYDLDHRATLLFDRESTIHNDPQAEARRVWATITPPL